MEVRSANNLQDAHMHLTGTDPVMLLSPAEGGQSRVGRIFLNSASHDDWETVYNFCKNDDRIVPFYGIHPWYADKAPAGYEARLLELAGKGGAVGEIGLDHSKRGADFAKQKEVFVKQLDIAIISGRPVSIHCVRAWGALDDILKERDMRKVRWMVHGYRGPPEILNTLLRSGAYISISPGTLEKEIAAALMAGIPLERLLIETDFPRKGMAVTQDSGASAAYRDELEASYRHASDISGIEMDRLTQAVWDNGSIFTD